MLIMFDICIYNYIYLGNPWVKKNCLGGEKAPFPSLWHFLFHGGRSSQLEAEIPFSGWWWYVFFLEGSKSLILCGFGSSSDSTTLCLACGCQKACPSFHPCLAALQSIASTTQSFSSFYSAVLDLWLAQLLWPFLFFQWRDHRLLPPKSWRFWKVQARSLDELSTESILSFKDFVVTFSSNLPLPIRLGANANEMVFRGQISSVARETDQWYPWLRTIAHQALTNAMSVSA